MQVIFDEDDFKDLKFNPFGLNGKPILESYKILNNFKEYQAENFGLDKEMVLRYIFIMYQESVLQTLETLEERKMQAALLAGFKLNPTPDSTPKFSTMVEQMLSCEIDEVNDMIIRTLRLSRKRQFINLIKYDQAYSSNAKKMMAGGESKEKMKDLVAVEKELNSMLEKAEREYLNYDTNVNLIEKLYDHIDAKDLGISPEDIAMAKHDGNLEKVLPDPYKKDE